ncbi:hypothetical protein [Pontibacter sp. SGAir0037]|uniref:hypothetical protein n=1 Tax=Pontibacter sp. SGAir0037 TaxID=2571030 RepID=UPI0010CCDBBA|nr:hypothetical protein [Pontibacter sp. SGAir0037]QCR21403.1 hypothetical protein C1N53_02920 [Pontibacter sp. SGAir0037]
MSLPEPNSFFKQKRSFSDVKQHLLSAYLETWFTTYLAEAPEPQGIRYIDLQTDDATDALNTPTAFDALAQCLAKKEKLREILSLHLHHPDQAVLQKQLELLQTSPAFRLLHAVPAALVEEESRQEFLNALPDAPALLVMDPFRNPFALETLQQALPQAAADILMLFSPESMHKALSARKSSPALAALLGTRLQKIQDLLKKEKSKARKQEFMAEQLRQVMQHAGRFTLLLQVNLPDASQADHFILFATRHKQAYKSFKAILQEYSDYQPDGVLSFKANQGSPQLVLFQDQHLYSLHNLVASLAQAGAQFKYKSVEKIYEEHHLGTNYTKENYLAAFEELRRADKVELLNPKTLQAIRKPTYASVVKYKLIASG